MAGVYIQIGENINWVNDTGAEVGYKEVVVIGDRIGIASEKIAIGATGVLFVTGVWELPANNTQAFTVGKKIYWDSAAKNLTTAATGAIVAGFVTAAKSVAGTIGQVKIN